MNGGCSAQESDELTATRPAAAHISMYKRAPEARPCLHWSDSLQAESARCRRCLSAHGLVVCRASPHMCARAWCGVDAAQQLLASPAPARRECCSGARGGAPNPTLASCRGGAQERRPRQAARVPERPPCAALHGDARVRPARLVHPVGHARVVSGLRVWYILSAHARVVSGLHVWYILSAMRAA